MSNKVDSNGIIKIEQAGLFYNVRGNDALILNKYLGYKLYGVNQIKAGFGVKNRATTLKKLDALSMNYDLFDQQKNIVISKKFENNMYEIIDDTYPDDGVEVGETTVQVTPIYQKLSVKEKLTRYIDILNGLSEGINILTGEIVENLDEEVRQYLYEMSNFFADKLERREKLEEQYPQQGKRWTLEEDSRLIEEFEKGKPVNELCKIFQRTHGSIKSRLLKFGIINFGEENTQSKADNDLIDKSDSFKNETSKVTKSGDDEVVEKEQIEINCEKLQKQLDLIPNSSFVEVLKNGKWEKALFLNFEKKDNGIIIWVQMNDKKNFYKYPSNFLSFDVKENIKYTCHDCLHCGDNGCFPKPEICPDFMLRSNFYDNSKYWPNEGDASYLRRKYGRK